MLEKIIRKYYDEIFRYCYHHVESRAVAEDLCQDTFVSFIERYEDYRHEGKVKNYLYVIAKNKCRDYYKKKTPLLIDEITEQESGECMEETVVIRQMVMSLPEEFREAVILRYFQNFRYSDIAAFFNVSPSLAKYRVKRGLELLAEMEGGADGTKGD
ncbi:MAG: RNA polymerase sigma factor [Butyrivibrio sp.]|nr:RNA polymerase sigma factor [Butyrivibrio sp.]